MEHFLYSKAEKHLKDIPVIEKFSFIREFGHERYADIKPSSLSLHYNKGIEICYIKKGCYNWWVEGKEHSVYPGEGFVTCPWEYHGNTDEVVEFGEIYWLIITPEIFSKKDGFLLGNWSSFSQEENEIIGKVLSDNKYPVLKKATIFEKYFKQLNIELRTRGFGYDTKIKILIEELILEVVRIIKNRKIEVDKEKDWIRQLNQFLQSKMNKKWSLDEMSAHFKMGTTSFNDKVKRLTGFSPQSYLIHIRVEQGKGELIKTNKLLAEIALETGFYSSQHFSSTFLKRVGITPSEFRRKHKV